jgi:GT2 family glycosyltransferase
LVRRFANGLKLSIIENPVNYGFAKAINQGIAASKGDFILSLNLDVELEPDYIEKLVTAFDDPSVGSATGKLYRPPEKVGGKKVLDTTGHLLMAGRTAVNRGEEEEDTGAYDAQKEIFGVCAAAGMYRREMLERTKIHGEYFDEDFFAYFEDVDLDWRAVNAGWKSVFVPEAVGYHIRGASGWNATDEMISNSSRNKFLCVVKNEFPVNFLIDLPITLSYGLEDLLYNHYKNYRLFFLTMFKKFTAFPKAFGKRMEARKTWKISPLAFRKRINYEPGDYVKFMNLLLLLAFIIVLAHFFGAAKIWLLAVFIFFVLNPAVYYIRRDKRSEN